MWPMTTPARSRGSRTRSRRRTTPWPASSRTAVPSQSTRKPAAGDAACGDGRAAAEHGQAEAAGTVGSHARHRYGPRGPRVDARLTPDVSSADDSGGRRWWLARTMRSMLTAGPLVESLARIPFFAGLDQAALERVAAGTPDAAVPPRRDHLPRRRPGRRAVHHRVRRGEDLLPSEEGDEAILATLGPGDVFGELALLDGAPRSATATALRRDRGRRSCRASSSAS